MSVYVKTSSGVTSLVNPFRNDLVVLQKSLTPVSSVIQPNAWRNITTSAISHSLAYGIYLVHYVIKYGATCTDAQIGSYVITSRLNGHDSNYIGRVTRPYTPITNAEIDCIFIYKCGSSDTSATGSKQAISWTPQIYANGNLTIRSFSYTIYQVNNTFSYSEL